VIPLGTFLLYVLLAIIGLILAFIYVKGFWKVFVVVFIIFFGLLLRREIAAGMSTLAGRVIPWFR